MPTLIKQVRNLHHIEFDKGRFDEWCVYLKRNGQERYAPLDTEYFSILQQMGNKHGCQKIYNDFVSIYTPTNKNIDPHVLDLITKISDTYNSDAVEMDIWFTVIYGGMIAEENKANAVLKKRIKRLGMHQVLLENIPPLVAAKFSLGKKYKELHPFMTGRGF